MPHQCTECGHVFPDGSKAMLSGCPDCGGNTFQFLPNRTADSDATAGTDGADASDGVDPEVPRLDDAEPTVEDSPNPSRSDAQPPDTLADPPERSSASTVGKAAAAVRRWVHGPSSDSSKHRSIDTDVEADPGTDDDSEVDPEPAASDPADTAEDTEPLSTEGSEPDGRSVGFPDANTVVEPGEPSEPSAVGARSDGTSEVVEREREDRAQADARTDVVSADELPASPSPESADSPPDASDGRIASAPAEERPDLADLRRELNDQFESIKIVAPGQYELNLMELYDREEYIIALRENGRYVIEAPETWLARDDRE